MQTCGVKRNSLKNNRCIRSRRCSTTIEKNISTSSVRSSGGPNDIWHIDGYYKLKPFGLAIHGAIDGYTVGVFCGWKLGNETDPRVVSQYFVDYIKSIGGTACRIRGDCGTENCNIARPDTTVPATK